MQKVVIDKPYEFVPPYSGRWWPWLLQRVLPWRLRTKLGVESVTCQGLDKIQESVRAGDGVLITPNHCRPCDPEVVQEVCRQAGLLPHIIASWHLFMQNPLQTFILRRVGAFSIYREGLDRAALNASIEILSTGNRPLVIFSRRSHHAHQRSY